MPTWELYAKGRVQGVGFRYFIWNLASELGIKGYVRNQWDGTVKIVAQTDENTFESFMHRVAEGNKYALVKKLEINKLDSDEEYNDFEIK
ncbi:MAG: acylphosphatase [Candidatus Cloacimonas sp.]